MDVSKYRHLSNEEFLRYLTGPRMQSPVIAALCDRIETLLDKVVAEKLCANRHTVRDEEDM
jgi:hypothetical protein